MSLLGDNSKDFLVDSSIETWGAVSGEKDVRKGGGENEGIFRVICVNVEELVIFIIILY